VTLRGFYDDNYLTAPTDSINDRESFGIELSPFAGLNLTLDQTYIGLSYTYGLRWYEDRESDTADQSHEINLDIKHEFSEQVRLGFHDTFRYAVEPDLSEGGVALPLRTDQNYLHNHALLTLGVDFSEQWGIDLYFHHNYWDYQEDGYGGSLDALLSRMEFLPGFNVRYALDKQTTLLGGYQYEMVDYTSDDSLDAFSFVPADIRNRNSHFLFAGIQQTFNPKLVGSFKAGAQISEYPNAEDPMDDSLTTPYFDGSLSYNYNPGSSLSIGVRYQLNATDVAFVNSLTPTRDQESLSIYGQIHHRITPKLTGSLLGLYQHSEFVGGGVDGENDQFFVLGVNFNYALNQFLSAEAGYNFDRLSSDLDGRGYTRNRVYLGLIAKY
jgi:hypothetical protein